MSGLLSVEVDNLTKVFESSAGGYEIRDISFKLGGHQAVSIMGPSGCGKSVILNMLCGIEKPTGGRIIYDGEVFEKGIPPAFRKNIGFVFQNGNLLPWRNVEKNMLYPLEIQKIKRTKEIDEKVEHLLRLVGLQEFKKSYPHELSGGMKQRLAFARALVGEPKLLILDQPFGALDAITRKMLNQSLLKIWHQTGIPLVLVTNNVDEALLYSSQILFMGKKPGRIVKTMEIDKRHNDGNENAAEHPDYIRLKQEAEHIVRALNINSSGISAEQMGGNRDGMHSS